MSEKWIGLNADKLMPQPVINCTVGCKHGYLLQAPCPYCEIDRLTAEVERLKEENCTLKRVYNQLFDAASDMQSKLSRYEAALNRLASCEDDSSWGDWVRDIAREALEG